ncbi:hypothetical protein FACS1894155_03800 [Bacteroidia bacterium]|nr:hypothetical protein FACS1894155_03800 [Bacteroidia bacterium]
MAKEIKSEIVINVPPEKVWAVLTDFGKYPEWNPFITSLKGEVEVGNKIEVRIEPPKGTGMTFKPKVLEKIENKKIRWLGSLLFKGLFDGEHCFELIDNGDGTTTFVQSEKFRGILVWTFGTKKTKNGFEAMNLKLKELAESAQIP